MHLHRSHKKITKKKKLKKHKIHTVKSMIDTAKNIAIYIINVEKTLLPKTERRTDI